MKKKIILCLQIMVSFCFCISAEEEMKPQGFYGYGAYAVDLMPEAAHCLTWVAWNGSSFELEDGSVWCVAYEHQDEVQLWWASDIVYFAQNPDWSGYPWVILNESRCTIVEVDRLTSPGYHNFYTRYIAAIDYDFDQIRLDDGSIWNVSWADDFTMNHWDPNDTILIGLNSGSDSTFYPFILINLTMGEYHFGKDEYVKAQLLN